MSEVNIATDINQVEISSLSKIKGQRQGVIDLLRVNLDAYFNSRSDDTAPAFGPVLLTGPSGTGKSLVAKAIHSELGNLHLVETNGEMLSKPSELYSILMNSDENSTVFIDETQGCSPQVQHILLTAISEQKLYLPNRQGKSGELSIPLAPFVLILATTHEYHLQDALRNRMRIYCRFNYYSITDLVEIVKQRADALSWNYESDEVLLEIAKRAKKTPRLALNRNLVMCWNVAKSKDRNKITMADVEEAFKLLNIDELGLDELEQSYLHLLSNNGEMSLNMISSKLGLPAHTISRVIEPYLIKEEFVSKGKASLRFVTDKGLKHISRNE